MAEDSTISWTDATWPIVAGCDYVSPGCSNCWAVRDSWRLAHNPNPKVHNAYFGTVDKQASGKLVWSGIVRTLPNRLTWPLKWRGSKRIFVCSQADLFHDKVPFEFIAAAFGVMAMAPQHTFQVLTKHAGRMREFFKWIAEDQNGPATGCLWHLHRETFEALGRYGYEQPPQWPLENVWIGVTVEDKTRAEERLDDLVMIPAAVRWVSYEPALELVNFAPWLELTVPASERYYQPAIDWIVCGGESAQTRANTRPFDLAWARAVRDQCRAGGAAFFMKQLGSNPNWLDRTDPSGYGVPEGKSSRYKWHEPEHWPKDLQVQEFPA